MRTLFAGLVTATLFLGCELDTGEDPPAGESGAGGSGGTASGRGGQSGSSTAGSSGSSAGSSTAGTGTGGNLGGAGKGSAGSDSAGGSDNAGGTTQGGTGGRAPNGGRGGMTSGGSGGASSGSGGKGTAGSAGSSAGTSPGGSGGGGGDCTADVRCTLEALPSTGDRYQDCVDRINQFRVECACLPPLERWTEGEACADEMSEYDSVQDEAHAGFRDDICSGGSAQNECPGYRSETQVVELCLQQMWDEGPPPQDPCDGDCFQMYGHFINMTNERYTKVACGFFTTDGNEVWSVQNYSR